MLARTVLEGFLDFRPAGVVFQIRLVGLVGIIEDLALLRDQCDPGVFIGSVQFPSDNPGR